MSTCWTLIIKLILVSAKFPFLDIYKQIFAFCVIKGFLLMLGMSGMLIGTFKADRKVMFAALTAPVATDKIL